MQKKNNKNNKAAPLRGGFVLTVSDIHFFCLFCNEAVDGLLFLGISCRGPSVEYALRQLKLSGECTVAFSLR